MKKIIRNCKCFYAARYLKKIFYTLEMCCIPLLLFFIFTGDTTDEIIWVFGIALVAVLSFEISYRIERKERKLFKLILLQYERKNRDYRKRQSFFPFDLKSPLVSQKEFLEKYFS